MTILDKSRWHTPPPKSVVHGTRTLIIGAGPVGRKHHQLLKKLGAEVALVDHHPPQGVNLTAREGELAAVRSGADLVVIATPPGPNTIALAALAAETGAVVLVEKPATLQAAHLHTTQPTAYLAAETFFDHEVADLLLAPRSIARMDLRIACGLRRSAPGNSWREHFDTGGGLAHRQGFQGLALMASVSHGLPTRCNTAVDWCPQSGTVETTLRAHGLTSHGKFSIAVNAHAARATPRARLRLQGPALDRTLTSLDAGLTGGPPHRKLRCLARQYGALCTVVRGGVVDPRLLPLVDPRPLQWVEAIYTGVPTHQRFWSSDLGRVGIA